MADLEVEPAPGAPPTEKAERLLLLTQVVDTELFLKFRKTCGTVQAPRPTPVLGRPTTSGKVPEACVYLGELREVLVIPLPGLGPVNFLSGQGPGSTPYHLGVLTEVSTEALQGRVQGPAVTAGEGSHVEVTTSEENEDSTARSKKGAGEAIPAEVTAPEEDEDGMARRKKDAGLCGSGALRRRARSKKGAGEDAPAEGTTSKEDEDCAAQPKESAELWSSGAPQGPR